MYSVNRVIQKSTAPSFYHNRINWPVFKILPLAHSAAIKTRKLSYRKDDRAMRPIYGCPEDFRESLTMPTATFLEIFNGFLFRSIQWMCEQN